MKLLEPGLYTAVPAADYHADCCMEPSLSSSIGKLLLNRSPLHAWHQHPGLNANYEDRDGRRDMDLGAAVHEIILGRGAGVAVIEAEDFKTKAARDQRDGARAMGAVPILRSDYETALEMSAEASCYLAKYAPELSEPDCVSEAVMVWQEGPEWCRAMLDRVTPDRQTVLDIKTTARSARADVAARHLFDMGYHFQAAFYERGLNTLFRDGIGRRRFLFLFQEAEAPYACQLIRLDEAALTIARKQVMAAIGIWQRCRRDDVWPGYPPGIQTVSMPEWQQSQWLNREMSDETLTGDDGMPPEAETNGQLGGFTL